VTVRGNGLDSQVRYTTTVDFDHDATHLEIFVNDSLNKDHREVQKTLDVTQSQQFHFVLSASDWSATAETGVRMAIFDGSGQSVFTWDVADGATRGRDVFLDQGCYTVRFTTAAPTSDTTLLFQLSGAISSESLGPQLRDTTQQPVEKADSSTLSQITFFWLPYRSAEQFPQFMAPTNVASLPLNYSNEGNVSRPIISTTIASLVQSDVKLDGLAVDSDNEQMTAFLPLAAGNFPSHARHGVIAAAGQAASMEFLRELTSHRDGFEESSRSKYSHDSIIVTPASLNWQANVSSSGLLPDLSVISMADTEFLPWLQSQPLQPSSANDEVDHVALATVFSAIEELEDLGFTSSEGPRQANLTILTLGVSALVAAVGLFPLMRRRDLFRSMCRRFFKSFRIRSDNSVQTARETRLRSRLRRRAHYALFSDPRSACQES